MTNLLQETKEVFDDYHLDPSDIIFIGSSDGEYGCTFDEFKMLADREYCSGYGSHEVALDLIILLKDGTRLMRYEYDGSEWWDVIKPIPRLEKVKPIKSLFNMNYESSLKRIDENINNVG